MTEAVKSSAIDFLGFGEAAVKNLVDVLHYELPLGPFYGHVWMETERNYVRR